MKTIMLFFALFALVLPCTAFPEVSVPPIPSFDAWEENMQNGEKFLTPIKGEVDEKYVWYYDGIKVYYQIAEYTKDSKWLQGVQVCKDWYRDEYVLKIPMVGAWRLFPHGLYIDYKKTGDIKSKEALLKLAKQGAFADRNIDYAKTTEYDLKTVALSREVAYNINCYLTAQELGDPAFSKPDPYIDLALRHLTIWNEWLKSGSASYPYNAENGTGFQPFMAGLTCEALIYYYESKFADPVKKKEIFSAIKEIAVRMWDSAWIEDKSTFYYENNKKGPAPDLNLLIAPLYAWLWHYTGEEQFRIKGDKLFAGGVKFAWLDGGKQFSQNYRWSFAYVNWRKALPVEVSGK